MTGRTIMIAGFHPANSEWVKRQPRKVEIWVPNEGHRIFPRYDRIFQMHPRRWREGERMLGYGTMDNPQLPLARDHNCFGRDINHVEGLRNATVPVYCQQVWPDIPQSIAYPFKEITKAFGVSFPPSYRKRLYVTSTFGYMVALALLEHQQGQTVGEIRVAGVELYDGREGRWERPNLFYWLGIAQGMGIKIGLPPMGTSVLNAPLYAIEGPFPGSVDSDNLPVGHGWGEDPSWVENPSTGFYDLTPPANGALQKWHEYRKRARIALRAACPEDDEMFTGFHRYVETGLPWEAGEMP